MDFNSLSIGYWFDFEIYVDEKHVPILIEKNLFQFFLPYSEISHLPDGKILWKRKC